MNTSPRHIARATLCGLLLGLLSSFAVAQSDIFPDDSIKPDKALSPDEGCIHSLAAARGFERPGTAAGSATYRLA